jgi:hypothetical protein
MPHKGKNMWISRRFLAFSAESPLTFCDNPRAASVALARRDLHGTGDGGPGAVFGDWVVVATTRFGAANPWQVDIVTDVRRVLIPMINEAINCVHEGLAAPEDIDVMMKLGAN